MKIIFIFLFFIIIPILNYALDIDLDISPVGYVIHYPFISVGIDEIAKTKATVVITRASWATIEKNKENGIFQQSINKWNGVKNQELN